MMITATNSWRTRIFDGLGIHNGVSVATTIYRSYFLLDEVSDDLIKPQSRHVWHTIP